MVKDSKKPVMISSKGSFVSTNRIMHITAFVISSGALAGTRNRE